MATTNINIRVDNTLKNDAEKLFNDLGLTMTSAITIFLRSAVNNNGIPFELKKREPNPVTTAALIESDAIIANPSAYTAYSSAEQMTKAILSDV